MIKPFDGLNQDVPVVAPPNSIVGMVEAGLTGFYAGEDVVTTEQNDDKDDPHLDSHLQLQHQLRSLPPRFLNLVF
jgi:hypothetical protein